MATAERVSHVETSDNWVLKRSQKAYYYAVDVVAGKTLEVGCGNAYAAQMIAKAVKELHILDKFDTQNPAISQITNLTFIQATVPPIPLPDNEVDFVISFQLIEHIQEDEKLIAEIHRVLKKGGKFIVSTPNKLMSLSRNPWHIREYTPDELKKALEVKFSFVDTKGVFGNEKAMEYYQQNKQSVAKFRKWDILGLENKLPAFMLQGIYDVLNRMNRKKLLEANQSLLNSITIDDFLVKNVTNECLDLYYIATK